MCQSLGHRFGESDYTEASAAEGWIEPEDDLVRCPYACGLNLKHGLGAPYVPHAFLHLFELRRRYAHCGDGAIAVSSAKARKRKRGSKSCRALA